jgi:hypothetical protein
MIPRLIWQTWKSKSILPPLFEKWRCTFIELHPTWEHWLWDDTDNANFVAENYPWILQRYDEYPEPIYRVDAVRYLFLYKYGGFYADLDTICLKSLDPLCEHNGPVLGRMGSDPQFAHSIPNALMASAPRQPFWLTVLYLMLACEDLTLRPEFVTGPVLLKRAVDLFVTDPVTAQAYAAAMAEKLPNALQPVGKPGKLLLLPSRTFYPLDWSDPIHSRFFRQPFLNGQITAEIDDLRKFFPQSSTITFWAHTW